jgi:hypothetical protein
MKHNVFCYECRQWVIFEVAGDLGQYEGDTFDCQCDREETVVPKYLGNEDMNFGLFHVASLEPPSDVHRWLRIATPPNLAANEDENKK